MEEEIDYEDIYVVRAELIKATEDKKRLLDLLVKVTEENRALRAHIEQLNEATIPSIN